MHNFLDRLSQYGNLICKKKKLNLGMGSAVIKNIIRWLVKCHSVNCNLKLHMEKDLNNLLFPENEAAGFNDYADL